MTGLLYTIILLGAIQGFIVSALLWFSKKESTSNRLLAVLLLLMALASINIYFVHTGWFQTTATLRVVAALVPLILVMPMGPLIWFYIQSCLDPAFTVSRKRRLHFYPVIIDIIPQLTAAVYFTGVALKFFTANEPSLGHFLAIYDIYSDIPRWLSLTVYVWLSYRYIRRLKKENDGGQNSRYRWLQQFMYVFLGFQCIWLVYLVPYCIPRYSDWLLNQVDWYPVYIPMAIMIYWLGIKGYLVSQTVISAEKKKKPLTAEMPADTVDQFTRLLTKAMEEDGLYLNPALSLDVLSAHTGLPPKTISAVLNQHMHTSFNEWINNYRIEAFKQKICQADMQRLTISAIAAECGFNSQATFQRIFKQMVGMPPSQYLKNLPLSA